MHPNAWASHKLSILLGHATASHSLPKTPFAAECGLKTRSPNCEALPCNNIYIHLPTPTSGLLRSNPSPPRGALFAHSPGRTGPFTSARSRCRMPGVARSTLRGPLPPAPGVYSKYSWRTDRSRWPGVVKKGGPGVEWERSKGA